MPGQIKSQKQANFLHGVAGGMKPYTKTDLSPAKAKKMLKDNPVNYKDLPKKVKKK